jgi:hypothetical protein
MKKNKQSTKGGAASRCSALLDDMRVTYDMADITSGRSANTLLPLLVFSEKPKQSGKLSVIHALNLSKSCQHRIHALLAFRSNLHLAKRTDQCATSNPSRLGKFLQQLSNIVVGWFFHKRRMSSNDPSSATRRTGHTDRNRDVPAGLDAMKGLSA